MLAVSAILGLEGTVDIKENPYLPSSKYSLENDTHIDTIYLLIQICL